MKMAAKTGTMMVMHLICHCKHPFKPLFLIIVIIFYFPLNDSVSPFHVKMMVRDTMMQFQ